MGKPYIRAVRDHLSHAVHVFDPFQVIRLFSDKLSAFRRELYRQASSDSERRILKGTRWLLLQNPENLDDRNELDRRRAALRLDQLRANASYLGEDLGQIWQQPNQRTAESRRVPSKPSATESIP